jgi:hypothetical protein
MRRKTAIAAAMAFVMAFGTVPVFVNAAEETVVVPIETGPLTVGVYFADNMVFTPQWRVGNFVRIEVMVIDLGTLMPNQVLASEVNMYTQAELQANPSLVANTRMVAVDSIQIDITLEGATAPAWSERVSWDPATGLAIETSDCFGREINAVGHLIYGGQWDTTTAAPGVYTAKVILGSSYTISYAMGSMKADTTGTYIFDVLADDELDDNYVLYDLGIGGVSLDGTAWLELGPLMGRGGGANGGNGGGNGGTGGHNGNGGKK